MDEIDDALPRRDMFVVPHAGAARADPAFGRDTGHLGEDEPGAAERALAIVNEMEVGGRALDRGIHVHRRYDDTVLDLHLAQLERRKHRWSGLARSACSRALPEPALDGFEPLAVAQPQIFVAD